MAKKDTKTVPTGLELMRVPFQGDQISQLPRPTKKQTAAVSTDFKKGIRCEICGQWHHPKAVHLSYVGHAALTDRLLECDIEWNWKPVKVNDQGQPVLDNHGGMWIELTVCGITRLGYGDAQGKSGPNAVKEIIGDALRNAAMRFGAALDLWHKGDLHSDDTGEADVSDDDCAKSKEFDAPAERDRLKAGIENQTSTTGINKLWVQGSFQDVFDRLPEPMQNEIKKAKADCEEQFTQQKDAT